VNIAYGTSPRTIDLVLWFWVSSLFLGWVEMSQINPRPLAFNLICDSGPDREKHSSNVAKAALRSSAHLASPILLISIFPEIGFFFFGGGKNPP